MSIEHSVVRHEEGRFFGHPANHGAWNWGEEFLVGTTYGHYESDPDGMHYVDRDRPTRSVLVRSEDGGESWSLEDHSERFAAEPRPCPGGIDFSHPDFALRVRSSGSEPGSVERPSFVVSDDRGHSWEGPYDLPDFGTGEEITARTDYVVGDSATCLLFVSVTEPERDTDREIDRSACVRTTDGGETWEFVGWITTDPDQRSIQPSTVELDDGTLVTFVRQRDFPEEHDHLDAFRSPDRGETWERLGPIAEVHNPAAAVHLGGDDVAVAYGHRKPPYGIRARVSRDGGDTWGEVVRLREDGLGEDLGYPRMGRRADGKLVTVYYYTTAERPEQHLAATVWDPF